MLKHIDDWIWNIVIYLFMANLILQIVSGTCYQKYLRFFTGIVMVIIMIAPIGVMAEDLDKISREWDVSEIWKEMEQTIEAHPLYQEKTNEKEDVEIVPENSTKGGIGVEVEPVRIKDD